MHDFVNNILVPYLEAEKARLGLDSTQKCLWWIDAWSVHRSAEFLLWMRTNHPNILIDFIPAGCTGVAQPLDVGINRPFKQAIEAEYHAHLVDDLLGQMERGEEVHFDTRIGPLRDASVAWLWAGYSLIQNPILVKKVRIL
jgi:hypothetical protein